MLKFYSLFWGNLRSVVEPEQLPKAAILLPLRGADPRLADTLRGLMSQDYPEYELHIILDHPDDPSSKFVQAAVSETSFKNVYVRSIENRRKTCSPQCSALYEAAVQLDDSHEIVCIIDGDVIAHSTWLHELVSPIVADSQVAIAHGNRWFMPPNAALGPMVRYLWNAAAIVPMYFLGIPWAGSYAIRHSVLKESGLLEKWQVAVVPDAPSKKLVDDMGLKVKFVPSLIMANRETCSLWFAHDFLKRQMMWTRTYHPNWWTVMLHAILTTAGMLGAIFLLIFSLTSGDMVAFGWLGAGLVMYILALTGLLAVEEIMVRRAICHRGQTTGWLTPLKLLMIPISIPITQFVYLSAVMLAHFKRKVTWRAVTYLIRSPWDVLTVSDAPFQQDDISNQNLSI